MGALSADAAVWLDGRGAGRAGHSQPAYFDLDHRGTDGCEVRSDGVQPVGGCGHRRGESADEDSSAAGREAVEAVCAGVCGCHVGGVDVRGVATESAGVLFVTGGGALNPLCLRLAPAALAILFFYSFTKRFTRWAHVVLGLAMGIAPAAAWIAVRGTFDPRILLLTGTVVFWGAGFDILYSCQDYEFDRDANVYSVPKAFGIRNSLLIARVFHLVTVVLLAAMVVAFGLGKIAMVGVGIVAMLLIYEHSLVKHDDLSRVNAAFFTTNGFISMGFLLFVAADVMLRSN